MKFKVWNELPTKDKRAFFVPRRKLLPEDLEEVEELAQDATERTRLFHKYLIAEEERLEKNYKLKKKATRAAMDSDQELSSDSEDSYDPLYCNAPKKSADGKKKNRESMDR